MAKVSDAADPGATAFDAVGEANARSNRFCARQGAISLGDF